MTTTNSIDRVGGTAADVSIYKLDESSFKKQSSETMPNGAIRQTYTVATGDPRYETIITIQTRLDPRGNGGAGLRSATISISTWARTETDGALDKIEPVNVMIAVNLPRGTSLDVADVRLLLQNVYALTYGSVDTKVENNDRLSAVAFFGVADVLGA